MFRQSLYRCPGCNTEIRQRIEDGEELSCPACQRRYHVMVNEGSGQTGLTEITDRQLPEPLWIPKGSIRALVTLSLSFTAWIMIFTGRYVPSYLFGLLLTTIGYYFGFRHTAKAAASRIVDISAHPKEPLGMPPGFIRFILTAGFLASAIWLHRAGMLRMLPFIEFFIILAGLIVGFYFSSLTRPLQNTLSYANFNHVKGLVVLLSAFGIVFHQLRGTPPDAIEPLVLASLISFYFGSRL